MAKLFSGILAIVIVTFFALFVITATANDEDPMLTCVRDNVAKGCSAETTRNILNLNSVLELEEISECLKKNVNSKNCHVVYGVENTDQIRSQIDCVLSASLIGACTSSGGPEP